VTISSGCEEHVVRRTEFGPNTPFGASNVPVQTRQTQSNAKANPQLSTDWRGTPKRDGRTLGQPLVPSGTAATTK
jgi:hypothetical protein